ncbi:uncharacterized protein B0H64DRAFT_478420 [Chaetomium fimeti]|uniref:Uncharacterized protein n=1 Tax=Chaetomium fimeti TaxID=1854472 RepID=A0AAE0LNF8_9PEZI|nr:hypothetical protein B0H64DRAFT_478420 [Chaetomium fimeti]
MSDILEAIKDAVNPKRREQATVETYDAHKRGPYPDSASGGSRQPQVSPPAEAQNPGHTERNGPGVAADMRKPRADSASGLIDYGATTAKPVHKEGGKYGLS